MAEAIVNRVMAAACTVDMPRVPPVTPSGDVMGLDMNVTMAVLGGGRPCDEQRSHGDQHHYGRRDREGSTAAGENQGIPGHVGGVVVPS